MVVRALRQVIMPESAFGILFLFFNLFTDFVFLMARLTDGREFGKVNRLADPAPQYTDAIAGIRFSIVTFNPFSAMHVS